MDYMQYEINETITDDVICIYAMCGGRIIGSSECSELMLCKDKKIWYFNRLYVHEPFRKMGIATELITRMLHEVKRKDVQLYLDINPYGNMALEDLEKFYAKHGFIKTDDDNLPTHIWKGEIS